MKKKLIGSIIFATLFITGCGTTNAIKSNTNVIKESRTECCLIRYRDILLTTLARQYLSKDYVNILKIRQNRQLEKRLYIITFRYWRMPG